jgi:hypothetical protein
MARYLYDGEGSRAEQQAVSGGTTTATTYYYANEQRIALAVNGKADIRRANFLAA